MKDVLDIDVMTVHISGVHIDNSYEEVNVRSHHIVGRFNNCGVSWI